MRWSVTMLVLPLLAGCISDEGPDGEGPEPAGAPCEDPWPCQDGTEWPVDLEGPFELAVDRRPVEFASHDGTLLRGWLTLPAVPDGTPLPTILSASPYHGLDTVPGNGGPYPDSWGDGPIHYWAERGYAFLSVAVRGTGPSGGCFENKGLNEQADQAATVAWAADQDWSNGRVAMIGLSYPGTTPWMAAIQAPPALKTIVPLGPVTDVYTEMHTPQGAVYATGGINEAARRAIVTSAPGHWADWLAFSQGDPAAIATTPERVCPGVLQVLLESQSGHPQDDRDETYWTDRQLIRHFPDVTAAVYLIHGLQETAHPFQEEIVWNALDTPRRALLGQWDHETPTNDGWEDDILAWMDFWLKGLGDPPGVGRVDYEVFGDDGHEWRNSTAWPPTTAREDDFVIGVDLEADGEGAIRFQSAPQEPTEEPHGNALDALCNGPVDGPDGPLAAVVRSDPAPADMVLAGNPYALLNLTSNQVGGQIAVHVYRVPSDCSQARLWGHGVADLRFHDGVFQGHDFPVGAPTPVRVDILNFAETLRAGEQIGVVFSYGDTFSTDEVANPLSDDRFSRSGQPYTPVLTVEGGSHLVLPFVEGGFGLDTPSFDAPPRPFAPLA